jgi:hypothetical protein
VKTLVLVLQPENRAVVDTLAFEDAARIMQTIAQPGEARGGQPYSD